MGGSAINTNGGGGGGSALIQSSNTASHCDNAEGYERVCMENESLFALQQLAELYKHEATAIRVRTVWDPTQSPLMTPQQQENLFGFLYRKMASMAKQNFRAVFPRGARHMTPAQVAKRVYGFCLIDVALADDDMTSVALQHLPGRRVTAENCPREKLYFFFSLLVQLFHVLATRCPPPPPAH